MDKFKKGGNKFNSNLAATNRLFAKNPLLKKRRKKAPGIYDPNAKYKFEKGGAYYDDSRDAWVYADGTVGPNGPAYADGGGTPFKTELSPEEEVQFQKFYNTLPENLQQDDPSYDIRGYWDSEGRPLEFDYSQPKEDDGYYHAYSINGKTGEYLKAPWHPTFQHAVDEDRKIGYRPIVNVKGEVIATENPSISDDYIEMDLTPEEIQEYAKGGFIVEDISVPELNQMEEGGDTPCPQGYVRVNGRCTPIYNMVMTKVASYITHDPKDPRLKAFNDSLSLHKQSLANHQKLREQNMIPHLLNNADLDPRQKKYMKTAHIKPTHYIEGMRTSKTPSGVNKASYPVYAAPRQDVIYKPKPKLKKQVVKKVEEKPIIKEKVVAEEPMQMMPIQPVTKVDIPLQKFIGTVPTTTEAEVMPTDETVEDVGYTEGGPDGPNVDWVDHTQRYIDWDGNSIGFNGIRFRKPGHGGDLIKKGRRHYLHYPSIESRYQAELVPEETEEEYAFGGEYNEGDEVELTEAEVKRLRSLGYIIEEA